MNCIHRALNQNSPSKLPFLLHAPTTPMPCSNAQFFFFEIFFITLPLQLLLLFLLFVVYSTWAQVSAGTLQPSVTGQGQFSSIVVVQVRRYDYASFTMLPPRHSSPIPGFMMLSVSVPLIMYFYHLSVSSTCHLYRAVSACIHACVFPILSLAVVLLYMGLSPATSARVSYHLYGFFAMLKARSFGLVVRK
jgi:hypothetical protein